MADKTLPLLLCGALLLPACASKGDQMRVVVPRKTTYLQADAVDGGIVEVPPRVLEEVRPTASKGIGGGDSPPSVVLRFLVDPAGRIREIESTRASDDRLASLAIEAISRWRVDPARRDGEAIPVIATVQLTFDVAPDQR